MSDVTNWPMRKTRDGSVLVVSNDLTVVSRVAPVPLTDEYTSERLGLDVDPADGTPLVTRGPDGRIKKIAPADADEWLLSAEWDTDSRRVFALFSEAVEHAKKQTSP